MNLNKVLGVASMCIIAGSVLAQVGSSPACCAYLHSWPSGEQGPQGACSGDHGRVCEYSSVTATGEDPMAMIRGFPSREANCYDYQLTSMQYFIRADCWDAPEVGAVRIGDLGDGTCCWIGGVGLVTPTVIPQEYHVAKCVNDCPDVVE